MKKRKGAVSLFLIIVMFSCVLLSGLFIDGARVLLAKRAVRNAANSAARSALSYYDTNIAKEYGMFAVDAFTAEEAFKRYFNTNLELSQNDGFNILAMQVAEDGIQVETGGELADKSVMQDQMEDYSKYRVVVNTSVGVVEKIKGIFGSGRSEKVFNAAGTGDGAMENLKKATKELSTRARDLIGSAMQKKVDEVKGNVLKELETATSRPQDMGFDKIEEQINEAKDASGQISDQTKDYQETVKEQSQQLDNMNSAQADYWDEESQSWKTQTNVPQKTTDEMTDMNVDRKTMDESALEEKETVDTLIRQTETRYAEQKQEIERKTDAVVMLNNEINTLNGEIALLTDRIDWLTGEITRINSEIKKLNKRLDNDWKKEEQSLASKLTTRNGYLDKLKVGGPYHDISSMKDVPEKMRDAYAEIKANYDKSWLTRFLYKPALDDKVIEIRNEIEAQILSDQKRQAEIEQEKQPLRDQIKSLETQRQGFVSEQDTLINQRAEKERIRDGKIAERDKLIREISAHYDKISEKNAGEAAELEKPELSDHEREAVENAEGESSFTEKITELLGIKELADEFGKHPVYGKKPMSFKTAFSFSTLADGVWDTIDGFGDTLSGIGTLLSGNAQAEEAMLFTDYIFSNCTYLTSQTPRDNRHYKIAEVEYVLMGSNSQFNNVFSTVNEIFMLRLLINFTDYMVTTQSPEIISRTLIAFGRAMVESISDMGEMIFLIKASDESASCGLCPSFDKIRLTYSDHLRLKMMIQALNEKNRGKMMGRFQTLMNSTLDKNNWHPLLEEDEKACITSPLVTEISADVTVEVDLVMLTLPMFEAVLPEDNQILQEGKFIVRESVWLGY